MYCLQFLIWHSLSVKLICYLPPYPHQHTVVAISAQGVSLLGGIEIALECHRRLLEIAVHASQQVVRLHLFVGCAVGIVVRHDLLHDAVGGEIDVCLVLRLGMKQFVAYAQSF
ncbi:MAG: hypothetical protein MJZ36_07820 [Bacteroidaceae bacterium]|nr:hypothetical protein [Bacteroidaceae bacterium]